MTLLSEEEVGEIRAWLRFGLGMRDTERLFAHVDAQAAEIERLRERLARLEGRSGTWQASKDPEYGTPWLLTNATVQAVKVADFHYHDDCANVAGQLNELAETRSRLSESEAAVRVLSEAIEESQRFLQSAAAGAFEESEGDCIEHELVRVEDVIASLPSSAAANAESHRRMRECLETCLQRYWKDVSRQPPEWWYVTDSIIAAQDALNPEVASAGKLHQELQGEK